MESSKLKLFNDENKEMKMPGDSNLEKGNSLRTDNVVKALTGEQVKTLLLPEEQLIELPNYVIDFSKNMQMTVFQKLALDSLLSKNGDTSIYLYNNNNIIKIGSGIQYKLEMILSSYKNNILNKDVNIYKDVERGKELKEVIARDITKLRMNI